MSRPSLFAPSSPAAHIASANLALSPSQAHELAASLANARARVVEAEELRKAEEAKKEIEELEIVGADELKEEEEQVPEDSGTAGTEAAADANAAGDGVGEWKDAMDGTEADSGKEGEEKVAGDSAGGTTKGKDA